jgi:protein-tyrosine phosphatase
VDRDEIVADYARSGERMAPIIARWTATNPSSGLTEQLAAFTAMAVPETMEHVLEHLHERWGGAAGFLVEHGQSADAVARWRAQLLVAAG